MPSAPPNPALAGLAATLGDEDTRELVRMFLRDFPSMLEKLGRNQKDAQRIAHSLKSSSHQMGAAALSRRLANLEEQLGRAEYQVTHDDLAGLASEFDKAATQLQAYARP